MASMNPFDLLGDDDAEDPSQLIAAQQVKAEPKKPSAKPTTKPAAPQAKLPSKPLPPSQAVREARSESARGGRGGGGSRGGFGLGRGRGGGAYRDSNPRDNSFGSSDLSTGQGNAAAENNGNRTFERRGGYGGPRGGRRGGFSNGEAREGDLDRPRRTYDRQSGTGRGNEMKREGAGRGNWGTEGVDVAQVVEEAIEGDKPLNVEKTSGEDATVDADKEAPKKESEVKEPEDKEMTLEEYEKVLEEKRKALSALKTEERKVDPNEFASMQPLANKKAGDDVFIQLGSGKDKKKEQAEKEERANKSRSINAFLKPSEGERNYGNNRGRGRGRGGQRGYYNGNTSANEAPAIEDPSQFPSLGGSK